MPFQFSYVDVRVSKYLNIFYTLIVMVRIASKNHLEGFSNKKNVLKDKRFILHSLYIFDLQPAVHVRLCYLL